MLMIADNAALSLFNPYLSRCERTAQNGRRAKAGKVISILFALMTLLAISCAITGTGSGFLDLSNIARAVCIGVAVICGILAVITWKYAESTV